MRIVVVPNGPRVEGLDLTALIAFSWTIRTLRTRPTVWWRRIVSNLSGYWHVAAIATHSD